MLESLDQLGLFPIEPYKFSYGNYTIIVDKSEIDIMLNIHGYINIGIGDVERTLSKSSSNYVTTGYGEGENGLVDAFGQSLSRIPMPLPSISGILFNIYVPNISVVTVKDLSDFLESEVYCNSMNDIDVFWGMAIDESLDNKIKVTLIAASK